MSERTETVKVELTREEAERLERLVTGNAADDDDYPPTFGSTFARLDDSMTVKVRAALKDTPDEH
jgi:hypothetical protein